MLQESGTSPRVRENRSDPHSHHGDGVKHMHGATQDEASNGHRAVQGELSRKWFSPEFRLALSATLHCLLGCGIGEVVGMLAAATFGMSMIGSMILAVVLGFVAGITLGIMPLLKAGFTPVRAFKTVIAAEGLSIAVMEMFEVWTQVSIPGVMEARLTDGIFWLGMASGLIAGFVAALPVNYIMIRHGIRHQH